MPHAVLNLPLGRQQCWTSADHGVLVRQVKDQFQKLLSLLADGRVGDDVSERDVAALAQLAAQVFGHTYHIHATVIA